MALDPLIADFLAKLRPAGGPTASLDALRTAGEVQLRLLHGPLESIADVRTHSVLSSDGHPIRIRAYTPVTSNSVPLPAIVYAHGGGWFRCSLDLYDNPCIALAHATGCVVLSVDYRLAPENKFPVPLNDYYTALCWAASHADKLGIDRTRLVAGGDSSGANLAAAATLRARDDATGPAIAHQLLLYPPLDAAMSSTSYREFATGYFLTRSTMEFCWSAYLNDKADGDSPWASPLRAASLSNLPSATILVCEYDPLRDEGEAYARRLGEAGVATECHRLDGMVHGCIHMLGVTPGARRLFELAGSSLRRSLNLAAQA
ncbi:alpha/beta hydrolase [Burkholderia pyrrocinia]|uniref:alpha/beta hydrolase n=1 Tax=Burkholderia pyrrocinia TaxID=60550 RepID=UPI00064B9970|nr:alpha/beta hydrolase [Burkholderia pyrrocinia]AKM02564.1 esterase [Burkholderia pyrrocinia]